MEVRRRVIRVKHQDRYTVEFADRGHGLKSSYARRGRVFFAGAALAFTALRARMGFAGAGEGLPAASPVSPRSRKRRIMEANGGRAIKKKILTLLDQHRIMTIATLRPDGWPQATTVGYANEGLTLYFLCGPDSQKAANLARDNRVSLTIDHDTPQVMDITGLSMAARAEVVIDPAEVEKAVRMLMQRYPQQSLPLPMPARQISAFFA
jgi:PPOX class probable F420-dependent enzyme